MRLADFILANVERIIAEWNAFARQIWPGEKHEPLALRDHAEQILRATVDDMRSAQTASQQSSKSKGEAGADESILGVNGVSDMHAVGRLQSGFDLLEVVAEYRALRASVIRLWRESKPVPTEHDLSDLTRFNESIDQSLAKAVRSFTDRVDRSRQRFLAILGHDLRNPLNSMIMSAAELSRTSPRDERSAEVAAQLSSSASAMARMISDLLDFTGAGLGATMPLSPAPMDLKKLCQEVVDEIHTAYPTHPLHFRPSGELTGTWDHARLRQMISNLIGNAIQHGKETEPVNITARGETSDVVLTVHNAGHPISPEDLPTIFEPMVRGTSPDLLRQRRPGSIGLGLYIAREVATGHGGTIDVNSSWESGTVFTVRLPRHPTT